MSRRIELHGPLRDQLQVHAEQRPIGRWRRPVRTWLADCYVVADLAQALGLAFGMLEGVA